MSRPVRRIVGIMLPILTIAIFVISLTFSLTRLSGIERDMRIDATQNMVWVISRAHAASLELSSTIARVSTGELDPEILELRYNVFLSRLALLDDGPQRRRMEALGFSGALDDLKEGLSALNATVSVPEENRLQRVQTLLDPYNEMLGRAGNKAMVYEWDALGETLDTSRKQLWQILASLIGISLAGAALCAQFVSAIRDAKRRTRLLDKEKAFSQLLIGSSGDGIVAVDLNLRCTVWNEAAERLFSLPAETTIGLALDDVSGFFQVDRIRQGIDKALGGQPAELFDQPFFPSDQCSPRYVDVHCFSLRDGQRIIGSILLISDVTERRAAQKEIADHRDHLEHLVQARTKELDAALARERETAELYRNFGTMISHQFRTPLAIVDSALQRLMRRGDRLSKTELVERGSKARLAIGRLTKLVESTLDAARLDAGQIEIHSEACDLGKLASDICARQNEQTPERQTTITCPEEGSAITYCDPVHVENILLNLMSNAVKYSPAASPINVTVSVESTQIECAVVNEGTLDGPAERKALFERYFRGRNAEGRQGIGVGLYMARALARLQGGDVQLQPSRRGTIRLAMILPRNGPHPTTDPIANLHQEPA